MPALWTELLVRIFATLDQADRDLSTADRQCLLDHLIVHSQRRRQQPPAPRLNHPAPTPSPTPTRDVTGDN